MGSETEHVETYLDRSFVDALIPLHNKIIKAVKAIAARSRALVRYRINALHGGNLALADFHETPPLGNNIATVERTRIRVGRLAQHQRRRTSGRRLGCRLWPVTKVKRVYEARKWIFKGVSRQPAAVREATAIKDVDDSFNTPRRKSVGRRRMSMRID